MARGGRERRRRRQGPRWRWRPGARRPERALRGEGIVSGSGSLRKRPAPGRGRGSGAGRNTETRQQHEQAPPILRRPTARGRGLAAGAGEGAAVIGCARGFYRRRAPRPRPAPPGRHSAAAPPPGVGWARLRGSALGRHSPPSLLPPQAPPPSAPPSPCRPPRPAALATPPRLARPHLRSPEPRWASCAFPVAAGRPSGGPPPSSGFSPAARRPHGTGPQ